MNFYSHLAQCSWRYCQFLLKRLLEKTCHRFLKMSDWMGDLFWVSNVLELLHERDWTPNVAGFVEDCGLCILDVQWHMINLLQQCNNQLTHLLLQTRTSEHVKIILELSNWIGGWFPVNRGLESLHERDWTQDWSEDLWRIVDFVSLHFRLWQTCDVKTMNCRHVNNVH